MIEVQGQVVGLKNLKVTGGWRLEIDLYETQREQIKALVDLVASQADVRLVIEDGEGQWQWQR